MNIINNIHNNSDKYDTSHSFLKKITYQNRFEENILPFNKQMAAWDKNKNNNVLGLMKMTNTYPRVINHVGVSVISLNKAVNWYEEVLGFSVLRRETIRAEYSSLISSNFKRIFGANSKRMQVAWLSSGNLVGFELFEFEGPRAEQRADNFEYWKTGIFHSCLTDPNIEDLCKKFAIMEESGSLTFCR